MKSREMREPVRKKEPAEQGRSSRLLQKSRAHDHCEIAGGQLTSESCLAHCPIQPSMGKKQKTRGGYDRKMEKMVSRKGQQRCQDKVERK